MTMYRSGSRPVPRPLPALPESRVSAPTSAESRRGSAIERELFGAVGDFYINPWASGTDPVIHHAAFELLADGSATFSGDLSAASGTFGTITAGKLQGTNITLNLDATGTQAVLDGNDWLIRANGAIELGDEVSISSTGSATFSGALSAATGSFAGSLSAATGTFAGALSAATGTFAGSLSAATGTFSGTVSASAVVASDTFTAADATFQGAVTIEGGSGDPIVILTSVLGKGVIQVQNPGGDALDIEVSSGGDAFLAALDGNLELSATGEIVLSGLPTSAPGVSGALWNDGGTVKIV